MSPTKQSGSSYSMTAVPERFASRSPFKRPNGGEPLRVITGWTYWLKLPKLVTGFVRISVQVDWGACPIPTLTLGETSTPKDPQGVFFVWHLRPLSWKSLPAWMKAYTLLCLGLSPSERAHFSAPMQKAARVKPLLSLTKSYNRGEGCLFARVVMEF